MNNNSNSNNNSYNNNNSNNIPPLDYSARFTDTSYGYASYFGYRIYSGLNNSCIPLPHTGHR